MIGSLLIQPQMLARMQVRCLAHRFEPVRPFREHLVPLHHDVESLQTGDEVRLESSQRFLLLQQDRLTRSRARSRAA